MKATIIYYTDFGKATTTQGELTAVIEEGMKNTGPSTNNLIVHLIDKKGVSRTIETHNDILIFEGFQELIPNKEWTSFCSGDFLKLSHQANKELRRFLKIDYRIKSELPERLVSLQPAVTVPHHKRLIGALIQKQLSEAC